MRDKRIIALLIALCFLCMLTFAKASYGITSSITALSDMTIGTQCTINYEITGGSGQYADITISVQPLMGVDGTATWVDQSVDHVFDAASGTLSFVAPATTAIGFRINCTDSVTGEEYVEYHSLPLEQNLSFPVTFAWDKDEYLYGDTLTVSYNIGGNISGLRNGRLIWGYISNLGNIEWGTEQDIISVSGSSSFSPITGNDVFVYIQAEDNNGKLIFGQSQTVKITEKENPAHAEDFEIKNGVLISYTGNDSIVTIPDGVKTIGERAFEYGTFVEVIIPDSVTTIDDYAFQLNENLKNVHLPDSVLTLGRWVFRDCTALEEATVPDSVTQMGLGVFDGCSALTYVELPNGITELPAYTFRFCEQLPEVIIPEGIESISTQAFYGCSELSSITIPESVIALVGECFGRCKNLTDITVEGNNPEFYYIDENLFKGSYSVERIHTSNAFVTEWAKNKGITVVSPIQLNIHSYSSSVYYGGTFDYSIDITGGDGHLYLDLYVDSFVSDQWKTESFAGYYLSANDVSGGHPIKKGATKARMRIKVKDNSSNSVEWVSNEVPCYSITYPFESNLITLRPGQTAVVYFQGSNEPSVSTSNYQIVYAWQYYVQYSDPDGPWLIEFTGKKPGLTDVTVSIPAQNITKTYFVRVLDDSSTPYSEYSSVIYLPNDLSVLEEEALSGTNCEAAIFPRGCLSIGSHAFRNCTNLKYILVPINTSIAPDAFEGCGNVMIDRYTD